MFDTDTRLRTEGSYEMARRAVDALQAYKVWPTPLNYELGLQVVAEPTGPLARAIADLLQQGILSSDDFSEKLARDFLPRVRMQAELLEAGDGLADHVDRLSTIVGATQDIQAGVSAALSQADHGLKSARTLEAARNSITSMRTHIADADRQVSRLRAELTDSAAEIERLQGLLERGRLDALIDPLTSLPNRRAFDRQLLRACELCESEALPMTLAMIDVDHFKRFNDTWGHQTGDQVLRFIGSSIAAFAIAPRTAARYGGEEFAIVMPHEDMVDAAEALDELRSMIAGRELRRRATSEALGQITVSIGVAQRENGQSVSELIERADAALYASKRSGRNAITCDRPARDLRLVCSAA